MNETARDILLCSQDPMLIKGLYGPLRDAGYDVEVCEHTADAIRLAFDKLYLSAILDSRDIGISVKDAALVIKAIRPDISIIIVGKDIAGDDLYTIMRPDAVDQLRELMHHLSDLRLKNPFIKNN